MTSSSPRQRAFSLIELIAVIAIIAILAAFTITPINTILRGSQMAQGTNMVIGQLNLARQQALSRSKSIEVRFYRYADPETPGEIATDATTWKFHAMQVFQVLQPQVMTSTVMTIPVPLDKMQTLPGTVIFAYSKSDGLSSIIDLPTAGIPISPNADKTAPKLARGIDNNYDYVAFRFLHDGSTNLSPTGIWYLTLVSSNDTVSGNVPPPNFFTLQIDPVTGTIRSYRPTAG